MPQFELPGTLRIDIEKRSCRQQALRIERLHQLNIDGRLIPTTHIPI